MPALRSSQRLSSSASRAGRRFHAQALLDGKPMHSVRIDRTELYRAERRGKTLVFSDSMESLLRPFFQPLTLRALRPLLVVRGWPPTLASGRLPAEPPTFDAMSGPRVVKGTGRHVFGRRARGVRGARAPRDPDVRLVKNQASGGQPPDGTERSPGGTNTAGRRPSFGSSAVQRITP